MATQLKLSYTVTAPNLVKYYTDVNPIDSSNPATLIKKYDENGSLIRVVLFNEESEELANFSYNGKNYSRMTDKISGKNMKPKNIYSFLDVELIEE